MKSRRDSASKNTATDVLREATKRASEAASVDATKTPGAERAARALREERRLSREALDRAATV